MALAEPSPVAVAPTDSVASFEQRGDHTLVRLSGDLDALTIREASEVVVRAVTLDEGDVVVDLADVAFMGAAAYSLLVNTSVFLQQRSRTLTLRAPSPLTSRLLDVCDIGHLVEGWSPTSQNPEGP